MKNIHIIETDKPSRLAKSTKSGLNAAKKGEGLYESGRFGITTFNIYITNDEEIKVGDWCLDEDGLKKCTDHAGAMNHYYSKIILTTDQDLINDGVQAIDDEFLEWFVKNPTCEEVEVKWIKTPDGIFYHKDNVPYGCYKIIIPKEEPISFESFDKEKSEVITKRGQKLIRELQSVIKEEPKQETLEEAAERTEFERYGKTLTNYTKQRPAYNLGFNNGAKWQKEQERMYSEEEVINFLQEINDYPTTFEGRIDITEWFEKFKNK